MEELRNALKKPIKDNQNIEERDNALDEYNLFEKKKIYLDNKSRNGNELAWVMDSNSVCISENGDGGPVAINEIDLPKDIRVGEVYEKIDGKYVYNSDITEELDKILTYK